MPKEEKKPIPQDTAPEGTVNVNKESLDKILASLEEEKKQREELARKLDAVADENRKQKYEDENKEDEPTQVRLTTYEGKIVVKWGDMPLNRVEEVGGGWITEQAVKYYFDDGTDVTVPYEATIRLPRVNASIMATKTTSDKDREGQPIVLLDLVTEDGKELTIDRRFVN